MTYDIHCKRCGRYLRLLHPRHDGHVEVPELQRFGHVPHRATMEYRTLSPLRTFDRTTTY